MKNKPILIGLAQAVLLIGYISLVVTFMRNGQKLFGDDTTFFGPLTILTLFATSALISASITLGFPAYLAFKKHEFKLAVKTVLSTAFWLIIAILTAVIVVLVK